MTTLYNNPVEDSRTLKLLKVLNIVEQWNDNRTNIKEESDTDDDRESLVDNGMFPKRQGDQGASRRRLQ